MIIPNRIMQAEGFIALAPAIARTIVFLDDDGWNAKLAKPRAERDAALAATDNHDIRLFGIA